MAKITDGVYFVPGQDEFIPDAHTYVVGDPSTRDLSLIDPGLMGKGKYKTDSLRQMGIDPGAIKRVIMTHTHFDHIGCLKEMLDEIDGAEIWIHVLEAEPLEQGDERPIYGMEMFREMCEAQYGLKTGTFAFTVDRKLQGGEQVDLGGMVWEVIHIPGHSMGSIGLYHAPQKVLIPGDVVYADYAIGRFDLYGANGSALGESLRQLAEREVDILLPGHNRILQGLAPNYIRDTARQWESYLTGQQ